MSIGVATPKDRSRYRYLSEHHTFGQNQRQASDYDEDLAASTLPGLGFSHLPQTFLILGQSPVMSPMR